MTGLLDGLLGAILVAAGNKCTNTRGVLVFEETSDVLHVVAGGLVAVDENEQVQVGVLVL